MTIGDNKRVKKHNYLNIQNIIRFLYRSQVCFPRATMSYFANKLYNTRNICTYIVHWKLFYFTVTAAHVVHIYGNERAGCDVEAVDCCLTNVMPTT